MYVWRPIIRTVTKGGAFRMMMAGFDKFTTSLRQEFGEQDAGRKFEVFCKWSLENVPELLIRFGPGMSRRLNN